MSLQITAAVPSSLYLEYGFLLVVRILAILMTGPLFSQRNIPVQAKIVLAFSLTVLLFPAWKGRLTPLPRSLFPFLLLVMREVLVGALLGFTAMLSFVGLQMVGQIIGSQMGFSLAGMMNPLSGTQSTPLDQFYTVLAVLIYLGLNGHHDLILAIATTLELLPLGSFAGQTLMLERLVMLTGTIFAAAVQIALPVMGTLILTDATLALISRAVPQLNAFIFGLPLKVGLGLAGLALTLPITAPLVTRLLAAAAQNMTALVR